jgi:Prolyl oligopeptidase family
LSVFHATLERRRLLKCIIGVLVVLAIGSSSAQIIPKNVKRPVTVAEGIQMMRFPHAGSWFSPTAANFSPDGKRFVVVIQRGDLERNTVEYSLLLWSTSETLHLSSPEVLCRFSSSSNREAIADVRWIDDDTIALLGENAGQQRELYTLDLRLHELSQVTKHPTSLITYAINAARDTVVFAAEGPSTPLFTEKAKREGIRVTTQKLYDLIAGDIRQGDYELFVKKRTSDSFTRLSTRGSITYEGVRLSLSPDGRYLVFPARVIDVPENWREYKDAKLQSLLRIAPPNGLPGFVQQYVLVDVSTEASSPLLDGPLGFSGSEIVWAPDSQSVVVSNVHLPLNVGNSAEQNARQSTTFSVEVRVPSREIIKVSDRDLWLMRWDRKGNSILFKEGRTKFLSGSPGKDIYFHKRGTIWEEQTASSTADLSGPNVDVILEEDLNTAPRIVAVDPKTHRRNLLLDLNPDFARVDFGKVEEISWKASDGHGVRGGLYLPPDYSPEKRYPLVIQTHGFTAHKFMIDGPWRTAFAARALAGLGFVVLQADMYQGADLVAPSGTLKEVASYEGAIGHLDAIGIIDRARVGIVGFSWTCLTVKYALTHSKYHFAAAVVSDGIDAGYFQYIAFANANPSYVTESDLLNGARPFGQGLSSWLERSPSFSLNRVTTPVLIEAVEGRSTLLTEWEWFSGLSRLGKPVDMLYLSDGAHSLVKPREQFVSQQATVDWFRFWLKGEEDPDPTKAEQYKRWRELRELQKQNEKNSAAPSLN